MAENINFVNPENINLTSVTNNSVFANKADFADEASGPNMPSVAEYEVRENDVPVDNLGKVFNKMNKDSSAAKKLKNDLPDILQEMLKKIEKSNDPELSKIKEKFKSIDKSNPAEIKNALEELSAGNNAEPLEWKKIAENYETGGKEQFMKDVFGSKTAEKINTPAKAENPQDKSGNLLFKMSEEAQNPASSQAQSAPQEINGTFNFSPDITSQTSGNTQTQSGSFNVNIENANNLVAQAKADVEAKTALAQQQEADIKTIMSQSVNLENTVNDCESKIPDQENKIKKADDMLRAFKLEMSREEADKIGGEVKDFYYYVLAIRNGPADLSQWFPVNLDKLNKKKKEEEGKLNEYKQQLANAKAELSANNTKLENQTGQLTQTVLGIMSKKAAIVMAQQQISMAGRQIKSTKEQAGQVNGNNTLQAKKNLNNDVQGPDNKAAKREEKINQAEIKAEEVKSFIANLDEEINRLAGNGQGFNLTIKSAGENINRIKQKLA